jgi:hypothetical protein
MGQVICIYPYVPLCVQVHKFKRWD